MVDGNAQDGPKNTYYILQIPEGTPPQNPAAAAERVY